MLINDVGQSAWEEVNDGIAGANYGWPTFEGIVPNPGATTNPRYAYPNDCRHLRHHRRRLLRPGQRGLSRRLSQRLFLCRQLRRLDPPTRHHDQHRHRLRHRRQRSRRSEGRRRRAASTTWPAAPVRSTAWPTATCRRPSPPTRPTAPSRPGRPRRSRWWPAARRRSPISGSVSRAPTGPTSAVTPPATPLANPQTRRQRRPLPRQRRQRHRQSLQQRGGADGDHQPGAGGGDHATAGRTALRRRADDRVCRHRHRHGGRPAAGQRLHLAGGLPSRHPLPPVPASDQRPHHRHAS